MSLLPPLAAGGRQRDVCAGLQRQRGQEISLRLYTDDLRDNNFKSFNFPGGRCCSWAVQRDGVRLWRCAGCVQRSVWCGCLVPLVCCMAQLWV